jgi:hypothetical protein
MLSAGASNAVLHNRAGVSSRHIDNHRADELPRTNAIAPQKPKKIFSSYGEPRKNEWIVSFDFHDNRRAGNWKKGRWGLS